MISFPLPPEFLHIASYKGPYLFFSSLKPKTPLKAKKWVPFLGFWKSGNDHSKQIVTTLVGFLFQTSTSEPTKLNQRFHNFVAYTFSFQKW